MTLMRFPRRSVPSSRNTTVKSRRSKRRSLGDKLQTLAWQAPEHLRVVEALVDRLLAIKRNHLRKEEMSRKYGLLVTLFLLQ